MSNLKLNLKDDLKLIEVAFDGYGDETISREIDVKGLFLSGTSQSLQNSTFTIGTDAHCYLDIDNPYIKENAYRLEGKYIGFNIFGDQLNSENYYKISKVKIGQRKLLSNEINNIHCFLQKAEKPLPLKDNEVRDER